MSHQDLVVVVMAGGSGTRFWPYSHRERPKQFLDLTGDGPLIAVTCRRVQGLVPPERTLVLTGEPFLELSHEVLPEIPEENLIGEPIARDTAAAVTIAAHACRQRFGDCVMAVLAADHDIRPAEEFCRTLAATADAARRDGALYTFGIQPTEPSTGYGYLELGECVAEADGVARFELQAFCEKPDRETAEQFVASGRHLWNSGMFVWTAEAIWAEIERQLPAHASSIGKVPLLDGRLEREELRAALEPLPKTSIDFGVMENAERVRCVRAGFQWSDLGGWPAIGERLAPDAEDNCVQGRVFPRGAHDNLVYCTDPDEVVGLLGVEGLVVIRAGGRTLVARRESLGELKALVQDQLRPAGSD